MRSMLLNMAGGLICAACLLAGLPVAATDLPEDEALVDPECMSSVIWKHQPGTADSDGAIGVATDAAGNVLIGEWLGDGRTVVAKYGPAGKLLSAHQLGSWAYHHVAWDSAGDFLIVGNLRNRSFDYAFVAKYSAAGKLMWTRQLDYPYPRQVATDAAGNVLVAGKTTQSYYCCPSDAFVAKYSATGQSIWTRTLSLGQDGGAAGVAADAAGNVFIAGGTSAYPELGFAFVAKYNAGGQLLWTRTLGSGSSGLGAATDPTGNILIAGETSSSLQGLPDAFVAKYSPAGKLMWTRQLGTPEGDVAGGVATDIVGNVVIGGWTGGSLGGPNQGGDDAFVAKYSPAGKRLWTRQFGTPEDDLASFLESGVATDAAGNVVISGQTRGSLGGPNHGDMDLFIIKLRP